MRKNFAGSNCHIQYKKVHHQTVSLKYIPMSPNLCFWLKASKPPPWPWNLLSYLYQNMLPSLPTKPTLLIRPFFNVKMNAPTATKHFMGMSWNFPSAHPVLCLYTLYVKTNALSLIPIYQTSPQNLSLMIKYLIPVANASYPPPNTIILLVRGLWRRSLVLFLNYHPQTTP